MEVDFRTRRPLLGAVLLAACLLWLVVAPVEMQAALAAENRPIELASACFFLAAIGAAIYGAARASGALRWYLALWAMLCLLFFGEETSWLQHFIGFDTPAFIAEQNMRGEFNLHNLTILHGGELVGAEFQWRSLFKAQHLFNLGFIAYFFGLPVLALGAAGRRLLLRLQIPFPGKRLAAFAFLPLAVSAVMTLLAATHETKVTIAETREMICALVILAFLLLTAGTIAGAPLHAQAQR